MKTLKELCTSPMPWSANVRHPGYVLDADDEVVVKELRGMDARLIAAAPELYVALMEIVCDMCGHCDLRGECERGEDGMSTHCNQYLKARAALAKASGEEVAQ